MWSLIYKKISIIVFKYQIKGFAIKNKDKEAINKNIETLKKVYADKSLKVTQNDFEKPEGLDLKIELDCTKYNEDKEQGESIEFGEDF